MDYVYLCLLDERMMGEARGGTEQETNDRQKGCSANMRGLFHKTTVVGKAAKTQSQSALLSRRHDIFHGPSLH